MTCEPGIQRRRSIRLRHYDYSQQGAYFVTVCAWNRECLFGEIRNGTMFLNDYGEAVRRCWNAIPDRFSDTRTDEFIIMPNHIHGIVMIDSENVGAINVGAIDVGAIHELPLHDGSIEERIRRRQMLLPKIIGYFKMNASKSINVIRATHGMPVWQRNYYEHVIRDEGDLGRIRGYVADNPTMWSEDENNPVNMFP